MDEKIRHQGENLRGKPILRVLFPIVISILALAVSFVALYLSQLRPAHITIFAGEKINIIHFREGNYGFSITVGFSNNGAQSATFERFEVIIHFPKGEKHLLEASYYLKPPFDINKPESWESEPVPVTIASKETVTKKIVFRSSISSGSDFKIDEPGKYEIELIGWIIGSLRPKHFHSLSINLSDDNIVDLKKSEALLSITASKWEDWGPRRLTEAEYGKIQH